MHRAHAGIEVDSSTVAALLDPAAFDHPADDLSLAETHISWVILAGDYAYKIKKPVTLPFLDFSRLDDRRRFCEDEVRLNRHWTPELYLDVVPVVARQGRIRIGGNGDIVDYAVRMRRFPEQDRLDRQLAEGRVSADDMRALAGVVADAHRDAAPVDPVRRARVLDLTRQFMLDNFAALAGSCDAGMVARLRRWTGQRLDALDTVLAARFDAGRFRECHGDLHLGNIVRLAGGIRCFDCVEFSEDLRETDVMADVAFACMDLESKQRPDLASHFLNRYLEIGGDYDGMRVYDLFFVYRCLVRAKVAAIRADERLDGPDREADLAEAGRYCRLAERRTAAQKPVLLVMHGLSGSGKSWQSDGLLAGLPAVRIRSDAERKRLAGLPEHAPSGSGIGAGLYAESETRRVYARLFDIADAVLGTGHDVILDAAFLRRWQRDLAYRLARRGGWPLVIVDVVADVALLRARLRSRRGQPGETSEAGLGVLDYQLQTAEPLDEGERRRAIRVDGAAPVEPAALAARVAALTGR